MVMVRGEPSASHPEGAISVLYNRCPHRGVQVCGSRAGNAGDKLTCPSHAWRFHYDGSLESVPLEKGYRDTRFDRNSPEFQMTKAEASDSYRGFIFARLTEGPNLLDWMGPAKIAIDDMCDRSPVGKVEVVFPSNRVVQRSNWKFFMENQNDAVHPSVTHMSTGQAAAEVERKIQRQTGEKPLHYHMLSAFTTPFEKWDTLVNTGYPYGHIVFSGYMGLRPTDPDTRAHEAVLEQAYAGIRTAERELGLEALAPEAAIRRLAEFVFDYEEANPRFVRLVSIENIHRAAHIARSETIQGLNATVISTIGAILARGQAEGVFRHDAEPIDVHLLMTAFCFFRVSNRHTLATVFGQDPLSPALRARHRGMLVESVLAYLNEK